MALGSPIIVPGDARLTLQTMGGARLVTPDGAILLEGGKPLALVAYLAATPGRQARRDHLVDLLWADLEPEAAKHALRQTLWYLKKRVGEGVVVASGDVLSLGDSVGVDRDVLLAAAAANDHEAVVAAYAGDFLPGFAAPGGADFEAWADVERRQLRALFQRATEASVRNLLARGRVRDAVSRAVRGRDADPTHQAGWRLLLEALVAGREWGQAQLECDAFERAMASEELELEPASRAQLRVARQGDDGGIAEERTGTTITAELVGREREFSSLLDAAERARRGVGGHVHLRAAAGLGKSRLLGDLLARLRSARGRAVLVRCEMGGRDLPYAAASELALALGRLPGARGISPEGASALVAMAPGLSTYFTVPNDASTGAEALRRRSLALAELVGALAEEQALALLIDDVHWMDAASRTILAHLAAGVGALRLLLVTAGRPVVEGRIEDSGTRTLELSPLTDGECAELVASVATLSQGEWSARFVHELWRTTAGAPLLVLETLQLLRERELLRVVDGEWQSPAPDVLFAVLGEGGALRRRVESLSHEERWTLLLLGVAGAPVSEALLAAATATGESAHRRAIAALEHRGLAARSEDGWGVAHDEIAATVLELASAESVRAAHAALGRAMWQASPATMVQMGRAAHHLVQGGEEAALYALFGRFVRARRSLGDARGLPLLAEELLGSHARPSVARAMVASLPLHVRLGLTSSRRVLAVTTAAMLVTVAATAVALVRAVTPPRPMPVAELLMVTTGEGMAVSTRIPILAGEWIPGRLIRLPRGVSSPVGDPLASWPVRERPRHPGTWLSSHSVRDSGVIDLFSEGPDGRHRITYAKGDDLLDDVSPDGRFALVATARWNADSHYDLAIVDLEDGTYRAVTSGDDSDQYARWNHAGDRIAFKRRSWTEETEYICLVNPDGSDLECPAEWKGLGAVVGWIDDERLLLVRNVDGWNALVAADVRDRRLFSLEERSRGAPSISPDGRWIACSCDRIGFPEGTWFVMPAGRSQEARPVALPREVTSARVTFTEVGRKPSIEAIEIELGPSSPIVGTPHRLTAHARMEGRTTQALARVRWRSLDPAVLRFDSLSGEAVPRKPGRARVVAELAGWASATRSIAVRADVASEVVRETWDSGWDARWWPFGEPRPVVEATDGLRALDVNGDGSFTSGAVLARAIPLSGGVALEARISVRITRPQWQVIRVGFRPAVDFTSVTDDDRAQGNVPTERATWDGCSVGLPAGEGKGHSTRLVASFGGESRTRPLSPGARAGEWVTVRLQLLPDGRCAIAVDGVPVFLSRNRVRAAGDVQVQVSGNAVDTDARIGGLTVWRGVPPGVEWNTLAAGGEGR